MPDATDDEPFELDELGWCLFAALIDGLRVVQEHERDTGITVSSGAIGDALVRYVAAKGKQIAKAWAMSEEQAERHHIRWGLEEISLVAREARNLFPDETHFTFRHFQAAQKALPADRQKQSRNWGAAMMETLAGLVPPPSSVSAISPSNNRNGRSSPAVDNLAIPESFADLLSRQIAATLLAINIKTLELTLERLRAHQALDANGS